MQLVQGALRRVERGKLKQGAGKDFGFCGRWRKHNIYRMETGSRTRGKQLVICGRIRSTKESAMQGEIERYRCAGRSCCC